MSQGDKSPCQPAATVQTGEVWLTWEMLRTLCQSKFGNVIALSPLFGYLVLYNDIWVDMFNGLTSLMGLETAEPDLKSYRLASLYFGSVLFGLGVILFKIRCDRSIAEYGIENRYVAAQFDFVTARNLVAMARKIDGLRQQGDWVSFSKRMTFLEYESDLKKAEKSLREDQDHGAWKTDILRSYYRVHNANFRRLEAKVCFGLLLAGVALMTIPSLDTLIRVFVVVFLGH